MLCGGFKPRPYCFGYCEIKGVYIHTPLRHCSLGYNGLYALGEGQERILQHWKKAIEWAQTRHDALETFYDRLNGKKIGDEQ